MVEFCGDFSKRKLLRKQTVINIYSHLSLMKFIHT